MSVYKPVQHKPGTSNFTCWNCDRKLSFCPNTQSYVKLQKLKEIHPRLWRGTCPCGVVHWKGTTSWGIADRIGKQ